MISISGLLGQLFAIVLALLVFDLGHWYRFYKLFVTFEWHSPMSIGAWLLATEFLPDAYGLAGHLD